MNVQALLHDSPPDAHRRRPDNHQWGTHPRSDAPDTQPHQELASSPRRPIQPALSPSSQSPAMASLRPLDAPLQGQPLPHNTAPPAQQPVPSRRIPSPPQPGIWGSDRSGSDQPPRDLRDRPRDLQRLPPLLDQPRKKNIAMEVNGPLSGPGVPVGPAIPGPGATFQSLFDFFLTRFFFFQMTWLRAVDLAGQASAATPPRQTTSSGDAMLSSVPRSARCESRAENATATPGKVRCISAVATERRVNGTLI